MSAKYGFRARLMAMPILGFVAVASRLPLGFSLRLGSILGWTFGLLVPIRRRITLENIGRAFPEMSRRERERLRRRFWAHVGRLVSTTLGYPRHMDRFQFSQIEGLEHFHQVIAEGKGMVAVSGHFGAWELLGAHFAHRGHPFTAVAQPIHNGFIHDHIVRTRETIGIDLLYTGQRNSDEITRLLRSGGIVAFAADGDARQHGTFIDFLGHPASTPRGPAMYSLRTGAPILPMFCALLRGRDHRIIVWEPIYPPEDPPDLDHAVQELTQAYTAALESMIRQYPEQYFWFHRRWKTRPEAIKRKRRRRAGLDNAPIAD
jgi:KDO2-lipid IV(A) lauroyltransferase